MRSASLSRAVSMSTGTARSRLDALAHLDAVEAGQHQVEHDEIGLAARSYDFEPARPVGRDVDDVALAAQPRRDRAGDRALVLDDEDAR